MSEDDLHRVGCQTLNPTLQMTADRQRFTLTPRAKIPCVASSTDTYNITNIQDPRTNIYISQCLLQLGPNPAFIR